MGLLYVVRRDIERREQAKVVLTADRPPKREDRQYKMVKLLVSWFHLSPMCCCAVALYIFLL